MEIHKERVKQHTLFTVHSPAPSKDIIVDCAKDTSGLSLDWVNQQCSEKRDFYTRSNKGCGTGNIALITMGTIRTKGTHLWLIPLIRDNKSSCLSVLCYLNLILSGQSFIFILEPIRYN